MKEFLNMLKEVYWDPVVELWTDECIGKYSIACAFVTLTCWILITIILIGIVLIIIPRAFVEGMIDVFREKLA